MPQISSFYGIIILMYWNDHNPPHFHAEYGEFEILICIADLSIYSGYIPSRALGLVIEWASLHKAELMETGIMQAKTFIRKRLSHLNKRKIILFHFYKPLRSSLLVSLS